MGQLMTKRIAGSLSDNDVEVFEEFVSGGQVRNRLMSLVQKGDQLICIDHPSGWGFVELETILTSWGYSADGMTEPGLGHSSLVACNGSVNCHEPPREIVEDYHLS